MRVRFILGLAAISTLLFLKGGGTIVQGRGPEKNSWQSRDRAVYVVSTLNSPLCRSGTQLSTVLEKHYHAGLYVVLKSSTAAGLYYIQVKQTSGKLLGVYAYQFGWKLPTGVAKGQCVAPSPSRSIVRGYNHKHWHFAAQFHTTYPKG